VSDRPLPAPRPPTPTATATIERDLERAAAYAASALAPSTRRAYERCDWRGFADWCAAHRLTAIPAAPATVAAFLAAEADREFRPVTIARREHGTRPLRKAHRLELDSLQRLLNPIDEAALGGLRDRALLLLGFAAALRRSELVALDVSDLEFDPARGLLVTVRKSKTDQDQEGARVAVPYARAENDLCAVRSLRAWLEAAGIHHGPVFRRMRRGDNATDDRLTDQSVALIVKRRAQAAGLPPALLSGHSLRAGYATAAARAGVEERKIANVTRHKNLPVLRGYIRAATAFDDVGEVL
jgi:integrase